MAHIARGSIGDPCLPTSTAGPVTKQRDPSCVDPAESFQLAPLAASSFDMAGQQDKDHDLDLSTPSLGKGGGTGICSPFCVDILTEEDMARRVVMCAEASSRPAEDEKCWLVFGFADEAKEEAYQVSTNAICQT